MRGLFTRINGSRTRNQQLSRERWAEVRAKGSARFILRQALSFVVIMTALRDVANQLFFDAHEFSFGLYIFKYALTGIFIGYIAWGAQEDNYKNKPLNRFASRHRLKLY